MAMLRSAYLSSNARLREAAAGGRPLAAGETSAGVAQVQAGLRDLGYALNRSTGPGGAMDGFYGAETAELVMAFQRDRRLGATGIADPATLGAVDAAMAARPFMQPTPSFRIASFRAGQPRVKRALAAQPASAAQPAGRRQASIAAPDPRGIYFEDAQYMTGTEEPTIRPDAGAGVWKSKPWTYSAVAQKAAILNAISSPTTLFVGRNATRHLRHYFGNHGMRLTIDLADMVRSVPSAREALIFEFRQVQRFLRDLPPGRYDFTSRVAEPGYNGQDEHADWYFAIGGYSLWGKGRAEIAGTGARRRYDVDFTYRFYDCYNWDGGKEVNIAGITITDEFMGEFHRQGLAREFDCDGSLRRRFVWEGDSAVPSDTMIVRGGGR